MLLAVIVLPESMKVIVSIVLLAAHVLEVVVFSDSVMVSGFDSGLHG